jgi:hypothetical protein
LECQHCVQLLYFENTRCECCNVLGYLPDRAALCALAPLDGQRWRPLIAPEQVQRQCRPWRLQLAGAGARTPPARGLNRAVPDLAPPDHLWCWQRLEAAKHRLDRSRHTSAALEYRLLFPGSM